MTPLLRLVAVLLVTLAWSTHADNESSAVQATAGTELLFNPSFEIGSNAFSVNNGNISGTLSVNWTDNTEWASPPVSLSYSISTTQAHSGNRSACVKVNSGGFAQFGQFIEALPAGKSYALAVWAKVISVSDASVKVPVRVGIQLATEPYTLFSQSSQLGVGASDGWVKVSLPCAAVPTSNSSTLPVAFLMWVGELGSSVTGEVCVDDASLMQLQPANTNTTAGELLENPSFDGVASFFTNGNNISGYMPQGWSDNTEWAGPQISLQYSLARQPVHGSSWSLRVDINGGFAQFAQWMELPAGQAYRLSLWVRAQSKAPAASAESAAAELAAADTFAAHDDAPLASATTGAAAAAGGLSVTLGLRLTGVPYTYYDSVSAIVSASWTQLVVPAAVIPSTVAALGRNISVGFIVTTGGLGSLWLDEASLTIVDYLPEVTIQTPKAAIVSRQYFCLNANNLGGRGQDWKPGFPGYTWPVVDFGLYRTWDSGNIWAYIQPTRRAQFTWSVMDKDVNEARKRGQRILFTLGQTPTWASSQPDLPSVYGNGMGSPPASRQDWKAFVRALLSRYRNIIYALEVWNEPNLQGPTGFFNGSPEQLADLAKATAEILAEPRFKSLSVLLLNPPMAGLGADAIDFLKRYFVECKRLGVNHGGIAWHSYNMPAELDIRSMETLRGITADPRLGLSPGLPVFNTEAGILQDDFAALGGNHTFGAGFLTRTYVLNYGLGVRHCCWYAYDADTMEGLTMSTPDKQDATHLNVAGRAYQRIMAWLHGAQMTALQRNQQGVWIASLARRAAAPHLSWIVWNGDYRVSSQAFVVPSAWRVSHSQSLLTGDNSSAAAAIQVTDVPVLLVQ